MQSNAFHKLLLLLPLAYQHTSNDAKDELHWNYETNGHNWEDICSSGVRQSPISLNVQKSLIVPLPRIVFGNYDIKLRGPLTLLNNGHTVHMDVPETTNGKKPFITGGLLKGRYVAEGLHFHWGSPDSRGSEHSINKQRFDVEMHIVHRNAKYKDINEAAKSKDGLAVIAVMLKIVKNPNIIFPGLNKVLGALPRVTKYKAKTTIPGGLSLGQMLGNVNPRDFFTYRGSLTTPVCQEAVTWNVFSQVLPVSYSSLSRFWKLRDSEGHRLVNNFRHVQQRNGRPVFYRAGKDLSGAYLGK
ncbi:carbonic anhydrase 2-like [Drosophila rhopaloa]|uniref:Carbonic anhydrase n=1 Tax=Drosophila rhopaloa TaxID=1041015 RepID=A0A6P4E6Z1_DRORH|nr:carbonic anhydrase 2-like [Drosophila rhopaloa]